MVLGSHPSRYHDGYVLVFERQLIVEARTMQEARIKLLQRMPIFGGIQSESLEYLLGFCPVVVVPKDDFFFREGEEGDALFVLEIGQAAVLKSWRGEDYLHPDPQHGRLFRRNGRHGPLSTQCNGRCGRRVRSNPYVIFR